MPLLDFLGRMSYRAEAVTTFLACLELIRLGVVRAFQARPFAEIHATRTDLPFTVQQIRDNYSE
jgi:chromatin segregation and condensation protein Rec8/ScpA/Scc1 (kleisin family)